jgi:hypothetical protein
MVHQQGGMTRSSVKTDRVFCFQRSGFHTKEKRIRRARSRMQIFKAKGGT